MASEPMGEDNCVVPSTQGQRVQVSEKSELCGHTGWIARIAWSADGTLLASASHDQTVRVWRVWDDPTGDCQDHCIHCLQAHSALNVAVFDQDAKRVAAAGTDGKIRLWDVSNGESLETLAPQKGIADSPPDSGAPQTRTWLKKKFSDFWTYLRRAPHHSRPDPVLSLAFDPAGRWLVSGSRAGVIRFWDLNSSPPSCRSKENPGRVNAIAFHPKGRILASAGGDSIVRLWDASDRRVLKELEGHDGETWRVAFSPDGSRLASTDCCGSLRIWNVTSGQEIGSMAAHREVAHCGGFSWDGRFIATRGDNVLSIWDVHSQTSTNEPLSCSQYRYSSLAFNPVKSLLAIVDPDGPTRRTGTVIRVCTVQVPQQYAGPNAGGIICSSAKIVLLGDSGVGKTSLGWRLSHGYHTPHDPTHGQQHWIAPLLGGTDCPKEIYREAVLWDLAGQLDYRLIHPLFLDDVDIHLGLVLFHAGDHERPFHGVEYWLKQLRSRGAKILLVAARCDPLGSELLTDKEIEHFCRIHGLASNQWIRVSASESPEVEAGLADAGDSGRAKYGSLDALRERIDSLIDWPARDTESKEFNSAVFRRVTDRVMEIEATAIARRSVWWKVEDLIFDLERYGVREVQEAKNSIDRLVKLGKIKRVDKTLLADTDSGEDRDDFAQEWLLLEPKLFYGLAGSMIAEARCEPGGRGWLEMGRLMCKGYRFPELSDLCPSQSKKLIEAVVGSLFRQKLCQPRRNKKGNIDVLMFPALITEEPPVTVDARPPENGVYFSIQRRLEHDFAWLGIMLGYCPSFKLADVWRRCFSYRLNDVSQEGVFKFDLYLLFGGEDEFEIALFFEERPDTSSALHVVKVFEDVLNGDDFVWHRCPRLVCGRCNPPVRREDLRDSGFKFCPICGNPFQERDASVADDSASVAPGSADSESHSGASDEADEAYRLYTQDASQVSRDLHRVQCLILYAGDEPSDGRRGRASTLVDALCSDLEKAGFFPMPHILAETNATQDLDHLIQRFDNVLVIATPFFHRIWKRSAFSVGLAFEGNLDGDNGDSRDADSGSSSMPVLRDCFLSFNKNDEAAAQRLYEDLEAHGVRTWFDRCDRRLGQHCSKQLSEAIRCSRNFVVLVGKNGLGPWQEEEVQQALWLAVRKQICVITVLLEGGISESDLPLNLSVRTCLKLGSSADSFGRAPFDELIESITSNRTAGTATGRSPGVDSREIGSKSDRTDNRGQDRPTKFHVLLLEGEPQSAIPKELREKEPFDFRKKEDYPGEIKKLIFKGLDHRGGHPSMPDSRTFDCFLSHNSRDKPAVRALAEGLRARGISVWLDEDKLRPGIPWQPLLESGIRDSRSVAVLVGADGLGPWEDAEMQAALSLAVKDRRPVIPVLLADAPAEPELPMFLSERIWVDLRPRADSGELTPLDRLIWGITGHRPGETSRDWPPRTAGRNDD